MQPPDWLIFLALLSLLEGLNSLRGGFRFLRLFRKASKAVPGAYAPPLTLIVPCRGLDPGLDRNLAAFLDLEYPDWQLLLVTDDEADASVPVIRSLQDNRSHPEVRLLFSGKARGRSQKVHNLLHALDHLRRRDRVLVFGDSDIRPDPLWLRHLVEPLEDPEVGASTGYRWYLPQKGGFGSVLRSVWNAGIASLMSEGNCYFAWGGAMAIRREVFDSCSVADHWQHTLSDDLSLSRAVKASGRSIRFQPRCLSFSHEDASLMELLGWSRRQLAITRVYHPNLWRAAFATQLLYLVVVWGGGAWARTSLNLYGPDPRSVALAVLVVAILVAGGVKAWLRIRAVSVLFPEAALPRGWILIPYTCWGPLANLVTVAGMVGSLSTRNLRWRGITYRMVSPTETQVLD